MAEGSGDCSLNRAVCERNKKGMAEAMPLCVGIVQTYFFLQTTIAAPPSIEMIAAAVSAIVPVLGGSMTASSTVILPSTVMSGANVLSKLI